MADTKRVSLEGRKLFVAIPTYDGKLNIKLAYTLAQLMPKALSLGISVHLGHVSGCSIITMARNMLVDEFLKSNCTDLLFIDADVIAEPDHILRLMAQSGDKDITAGAYPRRRKDRKFFMDMHYDNLPQYIGLALFVASELIGIARVKPNSLTQLVIAAARRAFPYDTGRR